MNRKTIARINAAVRRAREKHPVFGRDQVEATLKEEVQEFIDELNRDGGCWTIRAEEEALDTIAVLVRYIEEDE